MKFEAIKSILLTFLIALSLLLTFAIWNYEGEYEESANDRSTDAQLEGSEATKQSLIKPSQIVFHWDQEHLGFHQKTDELEIFQALSDWFLYDFTMLEEGIGVDTEKERIEIVFPTPLPSQYIPDLFTTNETIRIDNQFKRIILYLDENRTTNQIIFDNSDPNGIDITAQVQNISQVIQYVTDLQAEKEFDTLVPVELSEQTVYLPTEQTIKGRKFRYTEIQADTNSFKSIFFPNPFSVRSSRNAEGGTVYSDGTREMIVKGYHVEFTNFSVTDDQAQNNQNELNTVQDPADLLITRSIDHINAHKGWLVDESIQYHLYDVNAAYQFVEYRMMYENFPVFSNNGLSSMSVVIQNNTIYQYNRPLMKLTYPYDRAETDLMSAKDLIQYLKDSNDFSLEEVYDIQLGYRIEQQAGTQFFDLIPSWCIETSTGMQFISNNVQKNQGGNSNAMGSN
ncbi:YycH family regulatory protein [Gracilibacillus dipsosauri]|uniref:Regulatory protein YycH domain-containing protein n=2 Tax=Gracilibacillus dipsosauri TaxID=178340 RepID=A0A317L8C7_9BACI|nr:two-component system activity regulator YycH [Gracilibacillus dipsosauri]PWU70059.1 hypothetical protein DLJ74_03825 [Gracilibacillus dipsosauri]